MKNLYYLFFFISAFSFAQTTTQSTPFLPELFNPFPHVRDLSISNDQTEIYFTVEGFKKEFSFIAVSKKKKGVWQKPTVAPFSGKDKDLEAFLSPDNLKLYFVSNRKATETSDKINFDIWFVDRTSTSSKWSEPKNIGAPVNTKNDEFYPSVSLNGNLYFTATIANDTKGKEDIYKSVLIDGAYQTPVSLSENINSETYEFNAFISPDESVLVYSSYRRPDGVGGTDLYISTKNEKGKWITAKSLERINSKNADYCPFIDFKTNTLYFTSDRSHQKKFFSKKMSLEDILSEMKKSPNGQSRIYTTKFDL